MKVLLQRVSRVSVTVSERVISETGPGLLALIGFGRDDTDKDLEWMSRKILGLRIFPDSRDNMNLSVADVNGEIMIVSQFTLHADSRKGRRPSFIDAASPERAELLYNLFVEVLSHSGLSIQSGIFGAMMDVKLVNSGPVTIMLESPSERK
ncbi:MAG: D-tyrosyl-tRNA(Tyr) deacylase [Candidatus Fermentibacteraceae bacterium]|nr:D-tyrosyl-tRNA(Tyr) deacylase [Candidatus Fermentibacteraceae bacterium]